MNLETFNATTIDELIDKIIEYLRRYIKKENEKGDRD